MAGFLRYLHRIERSPNTLRAYAHDLRLFFEFLAGRGLAWDAVAVADLGDFAAWLRRPAENVVPLPGARPARSPSTTNRALSAVMGFYDFHARHGVPVAAALVERGRGGWGSYRPFLYGIAKGSSRARTGRLRTVRELPKVLTLAQIAAIIAAQRRLRDRFLFALLAETGMRVSQALGLRHEDMRTWERRVELVPREDNANGARGKGARGFAIVSDELVRLHALYMAEEYGLIDSDYVFINLWAGEIGAPLRYGAVDALVRRTRARVGFDFHPHMFRHTFVTVAQRHHMPLEVISKAVVPRVRADHGGHLQPPGHRGSAPRARGGGNAGTNEGPGVSGAALRLLPAEPDWREALEAAIRPEFRVAVYEADPDDRWLYGPHCAVDGCELPIRRPLNGRGGVYVCNGHLHNYREHGRRRLEAVAGRGRAAALPASPPAVATGLRVGGLLELELRYGLQCWHDGQHAVVLDTARWCALLRHLERPG